MVRTSYSYGAILVKGNDGRRMAYFPELPEARPDEADEAEARLRRRPIVYPRPWRAALFDGEEIPPAIEPGKYWVSPGPTVALKVALYSALRQRDMTVADLDYLLEMGDWHQAVRLIDPKRSTKLDTYRCARRVGSPSRDRDQGRFRPGRYNERGRSAQRHSAQARASDSREAGIGTRERVW